MVAEELHVRTVGFEVAVVALSNVLFATQRREAPVLGDDDLLATGEFVLGAAECFDGGGAMIVPGSHTEDDLANVYTSNLAVGLAKSTTHTGLESIGSGARQHLVDTDDVIRVDADSEMETFFAGNLDEIFVGANASRF